MGEPDSDDDCMCGSCARKVVVVSFGGTRPEPAVPALAPVRSSRRRAVTSDEPASGTVIMRAMLVHVYCACPSGVDAAQACILRVTERPYHTAPAGCWPKEQAEGARMTPHRLSCRCGGTQTPQVLVANAAWCSLDQVKVFDTDLAVVIHTYVHAERGNAWKVNQVHSYTLVLVCHILYRDRAWPANFDFLHLIMLVPKNELFASGIIGETNIQMHKEQVFIYDTVYTAVYNLHVNCRAEAGGNTERKLVTLQLKNQANDHNINQGK